MTENLTPTEKFNKALDDENKKLEDETWWGTCPGCGRTVTQEDEGKPCPSGCRIKVKEGKVPLVIEKKHVSIRHVGIRPEVAEKLKEDSGLDVRD